MSIARSVTSADQYDLTCAHADCKGENTHHVAVDIHARSREDADTYSHRVYDRPSPMTDHRTGQVVEHTPPIQSNPSSRRDGISIVYSCEQCGRHSRLTIEQHKGNTFLDTIPIGHGMDAPAVPPLPSQATGFAPMMPVAFMPPPGWTPPAPVTPPGYKSTGVAHAPAPATIRFDNNAEFRQALRRQIVNELLANRDNHRATAKEIFDQADLLVKQFGLLCRQHNWTNTVTKPV